MAPTTARLRRRAFVLAFGMFLLFPQSSFSQYADHDKRQIASAPLPGVPDGEEVISEVMVPVQSGGKTIWVPRPVFEKRTATTLPTAPSGIPLPGETSTPIAPLAASPAVTGPTTQPHAVVPSETLVPSEVIDPANPDSETADADEPAETSQSPLALDAMPNPASVNAEQAPLQGGLTTVDQLPLPGQAKVKHPQQPAQEVRPRQTSFQLETGVKFPIIFGSSVSTKIAQAGDPVEARLAADLKIGDRVIAGKGSLLRGHVTVSHKARRLLFAEMQLRNRWMRANGALGIQFDEVVTDKESFKISAVPAKQPRFVVDKYAGRILGINKKGEVASPLAIQLRDQGIHLAINAAGSAGGVFSMGAVPVVMGLWGAIDPSFAFMHPVGKNVKHRRLKGFAMGFLSGLPGGFLVADFIIHGVEAELQPGDEFQLELKEPFTGSSESPA